MLLENGKVNSILFLDLFFCVFRPDFAGPLHASDDEDEEELLQEQTKAPSGK